MIENYMGFPQGINGADLAERARQQAVKFGVELLMMREGVKSTFHDQRIWTDLADGGTMVARANVCATGVEWRERGASVRRRGRLCGWRRQFRRPGRNAPGKTCEERDDAGAGQGARGLAVPIPVGTNPRRRQCAGAV